MFLTIAVAICIGALALGIPPAYWGRKLKGRKQALIEGLVFSICATIWVSVEFVVIPPHVAAAVAMVVAFYLSGRWQKYVRVFCGGLLGMVVAAVFNKLGVIELIGLGWTYRLLFYIVCFGIGAVLTLKFYAEIIIAITAFGGANLTSTAVLGGIMIYNDRAQHFVQDVALGVLFPILAFFFDNATLTESSVGYLGFVIVFATGAIYQYLRKQADERGVTASS
ncbi:MAG: hypothetical protein NVV74_01075 [Magnetospirillum sp.]|nr:hypothetical protein [Magnetospirillum sp.]